MINEKRRIVGVALVVLATLMGGFLGFRSLRTTGDHSGRTSSTPAKAETGPYVARPDVVQETGDKAPEKLNQTRPSPPISRRNVPHFTRPKSLMPTPSAWNAVEQGTDRVERVYNREDRDPIWAPAMEKAIKQRLEPQRLKELGLEGTTINDLECRASACRIVVEYPVSILDSLPRQPSGQRSSPLGIINTRTQALGSVMFNEATEYVKRGDLTYERKAAVVAYDSETIDPANVAKPPQ